MPVVDGHANEKYMFLVYSNLVKEIRTIESFIADFRCAVCGSAMEAIAILNGTEHVIFCRGCNDPAHEVVLNEKLMNGNTMTEEMTQQILNGLPEHLLRKE